MEQILDEIQYHIWTLDLPIRVMLKEMRSSGMCIPKRRKRWMNFLAAHFQCVSIIVPLHCVTIMYNKLYTGQVSQILIPLYQTVTSTTRCLGNNLCSVSVRTNTEDLFNELARRKIIDIRGHRVSLNIT